METDKFEKYIKDRFKDREIEPSSNAWERVSRELGTETSNRKPLAYLWIGIAASSIILIGISLFYFTDKNPKATNRIELVGTAQEDSTQGPQEKNRLEKEIQVTSVDPAIKTKEHQESEVVNTEIGDSTLEFEKGIGKTTVEVATLNQKESVNNLKELQLPEKIIADKVLEIVAQVDVLEQHSTVTDAEVDSLLKRAQQEILQEKIFKTNTTVDALALLTAVEDELDQSFRDQIFNSLKVGFLKVRTAVADRNN